MKGELLSLLKNLQPIENKKLTFFLKNPYFSHNKNLILLLENLLAFYPLYEISEEDKEGIFKKIYGDIEYNDSTFRSLMHLLLTRVEDFIAAEYTIKNNVNRSLNILKFLYDRNICEAFKKNADKFENSLKKQISYFSSEALLAFNEIENLKYNYKKTNEKILHKDSIALKSDILLRSNQYLMLHFFNELVSDYVIGEIMKKKFELYTANSYDPEIILNFEQLESIVGEGEMKEVYNVYLLLYKTFKNFSDESFYLRYKSALLKNFPKINKDDASFHFSSMVSYCLLKKNSDNFNHFAKELWELYEIILENELYSNPKSKYLDIWLYRAILFLGLKLRFYKKVKKFIENYSIKIRPAEIRNIKRLSYAYLYYETGEYGLALEHACYIKFSNFVFKYDIKNLLIKIYYELNYIDSLVSLIESYRGFLKNDMILNSDLKKQFENFLDYIEKLVKLSVAKDKTEIEYLMNELLRSNCVYAKDWLLKKYSEQLHLKSLFIIEKKTTSLPSTGGTLLSY